MRGVPRTPNATSCMTVPVFVDTNVFLYARDSREATKQTLAAEWLAFLWQEQTGRTSVQVLSEFYVNATRKLSPGLSADAAWDDVQSLMAWRPQPLDEAILTGGRQIQARYGLSWWDSLVVAAAQEQGCGLLLTEDLQDGMVFGGVTSRSPFTLRCREDAGTYLVAPTITSRHRGRGRPRRTKSLGIP